MNQEDTNLELLRRCLDNEASESEFAELESRIRDDSDFRGKYLRYLNVDSALRSMPAPAKQQPSSGVSRIFPFPQWRPLGWAATAGLVFGLFCASVAWAFVAPRETSAPLVIPLLTDSFEGEIPSPLEGFPTRTGQWGGHPAHKVSPGSDPIPLHGNAVLSLDSAPDSNLGYLQQIIEVSSLPQAKEGEVRSVQATASFHAETTGEQERYTLRIATFEESPEAIRSLWEGVPWREMEENTLTMSKSGHTTSADDEGWQPLSVVVEVPSNAQSVVISLAAGRLDPLAPKTPHYLDDVRADLVISPVIKRRRPKRR